MSKAYYSNSIDAFLKESNESIKLKLDDASVQFSQVWTIQFTSWYQCIEILKDQLSDACMQNTDAKNWHILFEYEIPRLLSRIDVVIIAEKLIFVIEFKLDRKTYELADQRQVEDYALDLKDFHLQSRNKIIVPILLAPLAKDSTQKFTKNNIELVQQTVKANGNNLSELILSTYNIFKDEGNIINYKEWEDSVYSPTPTIIQAAQVLFAGQKVEAITNKGAINLSETTDYLQSIIAEARANNKKVVCFVSGVPGAGKTLVGLNVIHHKEATEDKKSNKAYFSGNGPLIKVLTEALTRDEYDRNKESKKDKGRTKDIIRSKIKAKIQNLHNFIKEGVLNPAETDERIVVFDEAQRCWDADNNYNKAIQNRVQNKSLQIRKSEAEIIFEIMERHHGWAVIIALIGNGQEINTGEAGIGEWGRVLKEKYNNWQIHISPQLLNADHSKSITPLFKEIPISLDIQTSKSLHLTVSQRSFKANNLNDWVNAVIDNKPENAKKIYSLIRTNYPVFITRDIISAKEWLRKKKQGNKRIGLVASSGGLRLRPYGINTREEIDVPYWFLNDETDVRSSNYLEIVATEYKIQGLEIDWVGVCWDGDLRRNNDDWDYKNFVGTKWQNVSKQEDQQFLLNKYRVLLTRAREGMVIWVPDGDTSDQTRSADIYDPIYKYLVACGAIELNQL